jgi:hypothetical protein
VVADREKCDTPLGDRRCLNKLKAFKKAEVTGLVVDLTARLERCRNQLRRVCQACEEVMISSASRWPGRWRPQRLTKA